MVIGDIFDINGGMAPFVNNFNRICGTNFEVDISFEVNTHFEVGTQSFSDAFSKTSIKSNLV